MTAKTIAQPKVDGNNVFVEINKTCHNINDGDVWSMCLPEEGYQKHNGGYTKKSETKWIDMEKLIHEKDEYSLTMYYYSVSFSPALSYVIHNLPFALLDRQKRKEMLLQAYIDGCNSLSEVGDDGYFGVFYGEEKRLMQVFGTSVDASLQEWADAYCDSIGGGDRIAKDIHVHKLDISDLVNVSVTQSRNSEIMNALGFMPNSFDLKGAFLRSMHRQVMSDIAHLIKITKYRYDNIRRVW